MLFRQSLNFYLGIEAVGKGLSGGGYGSSDRPQNSPYDMGDRGADQSSYSGSYDTPKSNTVLSNTTSKALRSSKSTPNRLSNSFGSNSNRGVVGVGYADR